MQKILVIMPEYPCEFYSTDLTIDIIDLINNYGKVATIEIQEWNDGDFERFVSKELKGCVYYYFNKEWRLAPNCEAAREVANVWK